MPVLCASHLKVLPGHGSPSKTASCLSSCLGPCEDCGRQDRWLAVASGNPLVSLGAAGPFLLYCPQLRKQQSHPTVGDLLGAGLFPQTPVVGCLRLQRGSKVLWGFLSFFFCLFLDKTSGGALLLLQGRLLRAAPPFSLLPSLGLKVGMMGRAEGHP